MDDGSVPRIAPSPPEQARVEALLIREILQERLKRPLTVAPVLALVDMDPYRMDPDRRIECLSRRSRVPLLWDLEGCTGRLAAVGAGAGLGQPLERRPVLEEISALIEGAAPVGAGPSRIGVVGVASPPGLVWIRVGGHVKGCCLAVVTQFEMGYQEFLQSKTNAAFDRPRFPTYD